MPELLATAFKILDKKILFYMLRDTHLTEGGEQRGHEKMKEDG